jgi:hypothetical protein
MDTDERGFKTESCEAFDANLANEREFYQAGKVRLAA